MSDKTSDTSRANRVEYTRKISSETSTWSARKLRMTYSQKVRVGAAEETASKATSANRRAPSQR